MALLAISLYLLGAIILTWPLAVHLDDSTPSSWADSKQTVWIFAWEARQLARDPSAIFQAPIYAPERDALAYSDHALALGLLAAPIIWATDNPYLAHNLMLIFGVAASGIAAFLAAHELLRDERAALVAGAAFAFAPYWFGHVTQVAHIQTIFVAWMPLGIFAILRWLRSGSKRFLAVSTVAFVMAALTSWYQAVFLTLAVAVFLGIMVLRGLRFPFRRAIEGSIALMIVSLVLLPFARPYLRVAARDSKAEASLAFVELYSATPRSFLTPPASN
ncbi:MAG: hypothetical protein ACREV8_06040, partial [Gammaproteobacteria bacterium]